MPPSIDELRSTKSNCVGRPVPFFLNRCKNNLLQKLSNRQAQAFADASFIAKNRYPLFRTMLWRLRDLKTIAPYGTWHSPVTAQLMTQAAVALSALWVDGTDLYWLESRPSEAGRTCLCRRGSDGKIVDVTPPPVNVGSRVHEYGGGAFAVRGGRIIFSERRDGSLWLIDGEAAPRRLATPDGCRYADFEFDSARHRVLAVREDHRDRPPTDPKAAVVAISLTGEGEEILVEGPDFLSAPRLSPDGQHLAWIAWDHPNMPWDATRLHLAPFNSDGRLLPAQIIAGTEKEAVIQPRWSTDGALYFGSDRSDWWNLYEWHDGALQAVAPMAAEIGGPAWVFGQRSYHVLPDGRILAVVNSNGVRRLVMIEKGRVETLAFDPVTDCPLPLGEDLAYVATPPDEPPALMIKATNKAEPQKIRVAAPSVLPPQSVSIGEPIAFPTMGTTGHAFFYRPQNKDFAAPDGERPPLIVLTHGGPTSMVSNNFALSIQWWTSRGFAVVDVNYGGSTGYGRPYRRRLDRQWGVVDVADCIAAVNFLAQQGLVDETRVVIRGGSAGGFTTLAALTTSDVFKAGASLYGVADLMLLARDTHKFESRYLDRLIGPLPEAEALYAERSPIFHIDRLSCPVIFFQGLEDKTVPPNQADTMVAAIEARGLPVAYYAFADEGHGFRKAETLRRVLELELDFYGKVFGFTVPDVSERVVFRGEGKA
jgi:dipeptidyl aminopeptidase/acylaminoacyl peptidase